MAVAEATRAPITIRPQPGPQERFLRSNAALAIYGGAAGGGKSWALLAEPLRHIGNPRFGAVIFRRVSPQIRNEGGLWDASTQLYPLLGGHPRESTLEWRFPSGATIRFAHIEHEQDKLSWQGSEIPFIGFDELTQFTAGQVWYLLSRNRSTCGVRPYVRGTTNPDAHSWVKPFLSPWLDPTFPEPAESGELRWMVRDGGLVRWVPKGTPDAISVTFVRASIYDNQILLRENPEYLGWLKALPPVERARLLDGDWNIVEAGNFFDRAWFDDDVDAAPANCKWVRFWDMAASKPRPGYPDPDWTVGTLMGIDPDKEMFVVEEERLRDTPLVVERRVIETAQRDRDRYGEVETVMEQEPGSSGVMVTDTFRRKLVGFTFHAQRSTGDKRERAKPWSAYCQGRHVHLVRGNWNHDWKNEHAAFPTPGVHDDRIDSCSGAFGRLAGKRSWTTF